MSVDWHPTSPDDEERTLALVREAVRSWPTPPAEATELLAGIEQSIRRGTTRGGLWERDGRPHGVVLWFRSGPLGLSVSLVYLRPPEGTPEGYRALLSAFEHAEGPVVFLPSPFPGLPPAEEERLLHDLGFRRFARSEMSFPDDAPLPSEVPPPGITLRAYRATDDGSAARVHARAFGDSFDRFLFLADLDPMRDGEIAIREIVGGRYGDFLPEASSVAESDGSLVGVVLALRTSRGALIADVATDPAFKGRGVGRAVVARSVRVLRELGVGPARLVVTEGNRRAIELYERLGFVRTLGPIREWYHALRVPAAPESP